MIFGRSGQGKQPIRTPGKFISTVAINGLVHSYGEPYVEGGDVGVGAENEEAEGGGEDVGEHVLEGVGVEGADGDGVVVLVVDLVDVGVDLAVVEESVTPVEGEVLHDHHEEDLDDDFLVFGERFHIGAALDAGDVDVEEGHHRGDHTLVDEDLLHGLLEDHFPFRRLLLPGPGFLVDSVSLKEGNLLGVDKPHYEISKVETECWVGDSCDEHGVSIIFIEAYVGGPHALEPNWSIVKVAEEDYKRREKSISFSHVADFVILENLLHGVIGGVGASC